MRFRGYPFGEAEGWHVACGRGGTSGGPLRGDDAHEDELCGVQRAQEPWKALATYENRSLQAVVGHNEPVFAHFR